MVHPDQVREAIRRALPDATVEVEDLTGGGDHLQVRVVSEAFTGLARVKQHQLVLFHPRQAGEGFGHHPHLKVIATAGEILHLHRGIGKGAADGLANLIRLDHGGRETVGE